MFQSSSFWLVLIASVAFFWLLPARIRDWFLVFVSFLFLVVMENGAPENAAGLILFRGAIGALLLGFVLYWCVPRAPGGRGRSWWVLALILFLLLYLVVAKYLPGLDLVFIAEWGLGGIIIPLGVSYFVFKLIHYTIEVRRGNIPPHKLKDVLSYVLLFPAFTAGPIERFDHFLANRARQWNNDLALEGLTRIIHGVIKRFAIVELVLLPLHGSIPDFSSLVSQLESVPVYRVWWYLWLTYLIAYLDFSAYTDIAIGASRLFGFRLMENFNFPVLATNISDFWRRWHMTLASWCQSYVYMPLIGLTRNPYIATYTTFLIMGIWHAASWHWIAWGLYHATAIAIHSTWVRWNRKRRKWLPLRVRSALGWLMTMIFVSGGYAFTSGHPDHPIADSFQVLLKSLGILDLVGY